MFIEENCFMELLDEYDRPLTAVVRCIMSAFVTPPAAKKYLFLWELFMVPTRGINSSLNYK